MGDNTLFDKITTTVAINIWSLFSRSGKKRFVLNMMY